MPTEADRLLTINTGSSSLKAAIYPLGQDAPPVVTFAADRIGGAAGRLRVRDGAGAVLLDSADRLADFPAALTHVLDWLARSGHLAAIRAVGHRVVHGGPKHRTPQPIDAQLIADLEVCVPLAPNHLPQAIAAIRASQAALAACPQFACFDTGFHRTLPPRARLLAIPRALSDAGVTRYGFHGLSYEYIVDQLRTLDPAQIGGRAVIAHLGNGASMAAVERGVGIDTSMGFTPTGGLVMGTRTGDLDPGVLVYLLASQGLTVPALANMLNHESGMLGVSATSSDMRDLLTRGETDTRAAEAVELFCYHACKFVGAYAAALGGLDTLVFTAGIGENSAPVRRQICTRLDFLGLTLDDGRNERGAAVISADKSRVIVRVIKTDEDLMIARHTRRMLATKGS